MRCTLSTLLLLMCPIAVLAVEVNPPVAISASKVDRTRITGRVVRYDDDGFTYVDRQNTSLTAKWSELDPATNYSVHERLLGRGTAADWLKLGKQLAQEKNGKVPAERAYARALRLDPKLKEKIDALKRGEDPDANSAGASTTAPATSSGSENSGAGWPKLTPEQNAAAIEELKKYVDEVREKFAPRMELYETKYFLFASDLQQSQAQRWAGVLDNLYARLATMFAIPKDENIWRGKALIIVFGERESFNKFEKEFFNNDDATKRGGLCHGMGNGDVKITFYRAADDQWFSHVLVHETTHGFLHRYRSPVHVPSWLNEGLAELVTYDLLPQPGTEMATKNAARADLQAHKNLDDLFGAGHIDNSRYPLVFTLARYLVETNKQGYVGLIKAIKDHVPVENAMKENLNLTYAKLAENFGQEMGVEGVTGTGAGVKVQAGEKGEKGEKGE